MKIFSLCPGLGLWAAATAARAPEASTRSLRAAPRLLDVSQDDLHPPVEGQRVGAHPKHIHHQGNHSHKGKHGHHHGKDAPGSLRHWGTTHPGANNSSAEHEKHQAALLMNTSSLNSTADVTSNLTAEAKKVISGMCTNGKDLCNNSDAAGWNCLEQCQQRSEQCVERSGADSFAKCKTEVEEAYGITWGRWMDKSRHKDQPKVNVTAMVLDIEAKAEAEEEAEDITSHNGNHSAAKPHPHPRVVATDDDDDGDVMPATTAEPGANQKSATTMDPHFQVAAKDDE